MRCKIWITKRRKERRDWSSIHWLSWECRSGEDGKATGPLPQKYFPLAKASTTKKRREVRRWTEESRWGEVRGDEERRGAHHTSCVEKCRRNSKTSPLSSLVSHSPSSWHQTTNASSAPYYYSSCRFLASTQQSYINQTTSHWTSGLSMLPPAHHTHHNSAHYNHSPQLSTTMTPLSLLTYYSITHPPAGRATTERTQSKWMIGWDVHSLSCYVSSLLLAGRMIHWWIPRVVRYMEAKKMVTECGEVYHSVLPLLANTGTLFLLPLSKNILIISLLSMSSFFCSFSYLLTVMNRWTAPIPITWAPNIWNATYFRPSCPQNGYLQMRV